MRKNEYAGVLQGYFHHGSNIQPIIIEYRISKERKYSLEAKISNSLYKFKADEFFGAIAEFLDGVPLPSDSFISIHHQVYATIKNRKSLNILR